MSKVLKQENWRVEVNVEYSARMKWGNLELDEFMKEQKAICEKIKKEIERHVDNVDTANIICDGGYICSYCGSFWEDDPGCCDEAIEEWEDLQTKARELTEPDLTKDKELEI